jgi:hypothetical protein
MEHRDWYLYNRFVKDVQAAHIFHVQDLGSRILSEGQYTTMRRSQLSSVFQPSPVSESERYYLSNEP